VALAVAAGAAVGVTGGLYLSRYVSSFLFEIEPDTVSSLTLPLFCLLGVALAAVWSPTRRATQVDPVETLRME
jgi:ABC-type lipoprotein release transport system permease subunit